jgi:DNA-binding transcriptional ArsR family regulator
MNTQPIQSDWLLSIERRDGSVGSGTIRVERDKKLIKALSHDLRLEILAILNERVASPAEIHRELDEDLSQVSYHVNVLKKCECVELVDTRPVRGSTEHFYRATERAQLSPEEFEQLPPAVRERMSRAWLTYAFAAVSGSQASGTLDTRTDRHLSANPLLVDEHGGTELTEAAGDYLERVLEIERRNAERLGDRVDQAIPAMVTIMSFEMPTRRSKSGPRGRKEPPAS